MPGSCHLAASAFSTAAVIFGPMGFVGRREPVDEAAVGADQVFVEVPLRPAQHARLLARPFVEGVRRLSPFTTVLSASGKVTP